MVYIRVKSPLWAWFSKLCTCVNSSCGSSTPLDAIKIKDNFYIQSAASRWRDPSSSCYFYLGSNSSAHACNCDPFHYLIAGDYRTVVLPRPTDISVNRHIRESKLWRRSHQTEPGKFSHFVPGFKFCLQRVGQETCTASRIQLRDASDITTQQKPK